MGAFYLIEIHILSILVGLSLLGSRVEYYGLVGEYWGLLGEYYGLLGEYYGLSGNSYYPIGIQQWFSIQSSHIEFSQT